MKIMTCGPTTLLYSAEPVSKLYLRSEPHPWLKQLITSIQEARNLRRNFLLIQRLRGF